MTKEEVESVLGTLLRAEAVGHDPPSQADWDALSHRFGGTFPDSFRHFMDLMAKYQFPGDVFNVSTGRTNGNDPIDLVYEAETQAGHWDRDMIPFYGVGNGDYFCLNRSECPGSAVYYFDHDAATFRHHSDSFDDWIRDLPRLFE